MNDTDRALLQLTARALFGLQTDFNMDSVDWSVLFDECRNQTLTLLIWDILADEERSCLSASVANAWEQTAYSCVMYNEELLYEQRQVLHFLEEADIPCVILKGSSSAACYPNPELRSSGDIDLLVKPECQMKAVKVLQEHGYGEILDDTHLCHMTVGKGNTTVEIHRDPNGIMLAGELEEKIRAYFSDAVEQRQFVNGLPFLQDDRQAVVLLLHKLEHFINDGFGLRQLCDWAVFVHQKMSEDLWVSLRPVLEEFGMLFFAETMTGTCVEFIGLPKEDVPWAMEYDSSLCFEMMDSILKDGNFGCKKVTYGGRLFTDPLSSNRVSSFFRVLGRACRQKWPICNKYPVMMPLAPVVLFMRYLKMHREGERSELRLAAMFRQSGDRQKLIKSLMLFMRE